MTTADLLRLGCSMVIAGAVAGLACWLCWAVGRCVARLADRRVDRHVEEALAVTRPLPRRKTPSPERLRADAHLREVEAELDDTYRVLQDLYLT